MTPAIELVASLRALAPTAHNLSADSRRIEAGDVFLAFPGAEHDGRDHIASAIHAGAAAVAWEPDGGEWDSAWRVPHLPIADLKLHAAALAATWYGQPSQALWMTGVTGTNGKTSVAQWLAAAFSDLGRKTATIGTLGNGFPGALTATGHTTPDAVSLQRLLADFRHAGAAGVAMEVSSHGLDQGRVEGVEFDVAVFTNLSRDHLDYHGDMQQYAAAKTRLFHWPGLQAAVLNADDELGAALVEQLRTSSARVLSYGLKAGDLRAQQLQADRHGLRLEITSPWGDGRLDSPLLGEFNAYNLLAALGALLVSEVPLQQALAALAKMQPVAGRMQRVDASADDPSVIIDFAHTPDALDKVLAALKPLTSGRLICVFGCGGGRDTGKRPLMGTAVAAHADLAIVTSDNPRHEDPAHIVAGILAGMPPDYMVDPHARKTGSLPPEGALCPPWDGPAAGIVILDRRAAISTAILQAGADDIVVLAGKGHEDYQEINGVKHPFSDLAEARLALAARSNQPARNSHAPA
jgi:UDP-N-acetylmuramoyl-L-alanyl-D-glutamate--2,6-diaminopimelate ligase